MSASEEYRVGSGSKFVLVDSRRLVRGERCEQSRACGAAGHRAGCCVGGFGNTPTCVRFPCSRHQASVRSARAPPGPLGVARDPYVGVIGVRDFEAFFLLAERFLLPA